MLTALKVDSVQEEVSNGSGEMQTPGKNSKEMLDTKDMVAEMKNAFNGLMSEWNE